MPEPSLKEFAQLANAVYRNDCRRGEKIEGWALCGEPHDNESNGLRVALYKKENRSEYIFSIRGTDNFQNVRTTASAVSRESDVRTLEECKQKVVSMINAHCSDGIVYITGHSLGALLAEVVAVENDEIRKAITFESPGSFPWVKHQSAEKRGRIDSYIVNRYVGMSDSGPRSESGSIISNFSKPGGNQFGIRTEAPPVKRELAEGARSQSVRSLLEWLCGDVVGGVTADVFNVGSTIYLEFYLMHSMDNICSAIDKNWHDPQVLSRISNTSSGHNQSTLNDSEPVIQSHGSSRETQNNTRRQDMNQGEASSSTAVAVGARPLLERSELDSGFSGLSVLSGSQRAGTLKLQRERCEHLQKKVKDRLDRVQSSQGRGTRFNFALDDIEVDEMAKVCINFEGSSAFKADSSRHGSSNNVRGSLWGISGSSSDHELHQSHHTDKKFLASFKVETKQGFKLKDDTKISALSEEDEGIVWTYVKSGYFQRSFTLNIVSGIEIKKNSSEASQDGEFNMRTFLSASSMVTNAAAHADDDRRFQMEVFSDGLDVPGIGIDSDLSTVNGDFVTGILNQLTASVGDKLQEESYGFYCSNKKQTDLFSLMKSFSDELDRSVVRRQDPHLAELRRILDALYQPLTDTFFQRYLSESCELIQAVQRNGVILGGVLKDGKLLDGFFKVSKGRCLAIVNHVPMLLDSSSQSSSQNFQIVKCGEGELFYLFAGEEKLKILENDLWTLFKESHGYTLRTIDGMQLCYKKNERGVCDFSLSKNPMANEKLIFFLEDGLFCGHYLSQLKASFNKASPELLNSNEKEKKEDNKFFQSELKEIVEYAEKFRALHSIPIVGSSQAGKTSILTLLMGYGLKSTNLGRLVHDGAKELREEHKTLKIGSGSGGSVTPGPIGYRIFGKDFILMDTAGFFDSKTSKRDKNKFAMFLTQYMTASFRRVIVVLDLPAINSGTKEGLRDIVNQLVQIFSEDGESINVDFSSRVLFILNPKDESSYSDVKVKAIFQEGLETWMIEQTGFSNDRIKKAKEIINASRRCDLELTDEDCLAFMEFILKNATRFSLGNATVVFFTKALNDRPPIDGRNIQSWLVRDGLDDKKISQLYFEFLLDEHERLERKFSLWRQIASSVCDALDQDRAVLWKFPENNQMLIEKIESFCSVPAIDNRPFLSFKYPAHNSGFHKNFDQSCRDEYEQLSEIGQKKIDELQGKLDKLQVADVQVRIKELFAGISDEIKFLIPYVYAYLKRSLPNSSSDAKTSMGVPYSNGFLDELQWYARWFGSLFGADSPEVVSRKLERYSGVEPIFEVSYSVLDISNNQPDNNVPNMASLAPSFKQESIEVKRVGDPRFSDDLKDCEVEYRSPGNWKVAIESTKVATRYTRRLFSDVTLFGNDVLSKLPGLLSDLDRFSKESRHAHFNWIGNIIAESVREEFRSGLKELKEKSSSILEVGVYDRGRCQKLENLRDELLRFQVIFEKINKAVKDAISVDSGVLLDRYRRIGDSAEARAEREAEIKTTQDLKNMKERARESSRAVYRSEYEILLPIWNAMRHANCSFSNLDTYMRLCQEVYPEFRSIKEKEPGISISGASQDAVAKQKTSTFGKEKGGVDAKAAPASNSSRAGSSKGQLAEEAKDGSKGYPASGIAGGFATASAFFQGQSASGGLKEGEKLKRPPSPKKGLW